MQVKTASWNRAQGPWEYLQVRTRPTGKYQTSAPLAEGYDTLFVIKDAAAWIIPASEIDSSNLSLQKTRPDGTPSKWEKYKVSLSN